MNNPVLYNYTYRLIYTGIWILFASIQMLVLYLYSDLNWMFITSDAAIFTSLLAGCVLALWYPVRFNRGASNGWIFVGFHVLLAIITLSCWLGVGSILMNLCTSDDFYYHSFFLSSIPLRIVVGLLTYVVAILVYYLLMNISDLKQKTEMEVQSDEEILSRVAVKRKQEIRVIPVHEIMYLEADGDYVHIHTKDDRFLKEKTMKYWENHLPASLFVRIHRSCIVNVEYIAKIEIYEKESYRMYLKNGVCLKASSTGYKLLKQLVQL